MEVIFFSLPKEHFAKHEKSLTLSISREDRKMIASVNYSLY